MDAEHPSVPGATNSSHVFAMAGSSTAASSNGPITTLSATSPANSAVNNISNVTFTVSATALDNYAGNSESKSTSTCTNLTQSLGVARVNPRSNSSIFRSSFSISTVADAAAMKALSGGSAGTSLSAKSSSIPFSINTVTTNSVIGSNGMTSSAIALYLSPESSNGHSGGIAAQTALVLITSASSPAEFMVSSNQTSNISTSISSTKFVKAVVHSNTTLLKLQATGSTQLSGSNLLSQNTLLSSMSSLACANLTSSTSILLSLTSMTNLANYGFLARSNLFSTSSNSGTHTVSATNQVAVPITSLNPTNAAAIADGIAIGRGLALLYDKAYSITDISALEASKPDIIKSIETLDSDLKRLSLDLGGSGTSTCGKNRSKFRRRKRGILGRLLDTIASTVCSLVKVQADIDNSSAGFG